MKDLKSESQRSEIILRSKHQESTRLGLWDTGTPDEFAKRLQNLSVPLSSGTSPNLRLREKQKGCFNAKVILSNINAPR